MHHGITKINPKQTLNLAIVVTRIERVHKLTGRRIRLRQNGKKYLQIIRDWQNVSKCDSGLAVKMS